MRSFFNFFTLCLCTFFSTVSLAQEMPIRSLESINQQWQFHLISVEDSLGIVSVSDIKDWEAVSLPHDWAIAGPFIKGSKGHTGKLAWKGQAWYQRQLNLPAFNMGQRAYLIFDGVMAMPSIYLNGHLVGTYDYGYNSFYVDITPYLNEQGGNLLQVHVDTRAHDSRWYPGAGIYRKVQLLLTNEVHIDIWGTQISTPIIKPHYAEVKVNTEIVNKSGNPVNVQLLHEIIDQEGRTVSAQKTKEQNLVGSHALIGERLTVSHPKLWGTDMPYLYQLKTTVFTNGDITDQKVSTFGVRQVEFTAENGFILNGDRVQLKGVNLHHDHGPLGAAFYPRAMERQLEMMKKMGCNAIRTSHNTPAPELLQLCDEMGLLVYSEIFDKYDAKADLGSQQNFESFAERTIRDFARRDRNHPSIIIWSVGNEIDHVQWDTSNGFYQLNFLVQELKKYDSSRPVTLACHIPESAKMRHFDLYDVHSWNYERRYALARQMEPTKSVIISESASTLSTRGYYDFPEKVKKSVFTDSMQVSSYDLHCPWWAEIPDDDFMWQQEEPYVAGEFVWTGFDYLGEPTPYDGTYFQYDLMEGNESLDTLESSRSSYFGIVDLVGLPKDRYFLYQSYWNSKVNTLHILPHWNWPNRINKATPIFVYTNGDCVELFLNGKSLGKKCKIPQADDAKSRFRLVWDQVPYTPGKITAKAYRDGQLMAEKSMHTAGEIYRLKLTPNRSTLCADGMDLSYITVEAIDKAGNLCPWANNLVEVALEGDASLLGVGNGNPQSMHPFIASNVPLFYGKAMLIVKASSSESITKVRVTSSGIKGDVVSINVGK